mmetsp:Transcript_17430/g.26044  ORF Transcript_17430/g.26044 Transcript_17430/m.26044 type:complete len:855 (-) Transcript_17430:362-2926(-)
MILGIKNFPVLLATLFALALDPAVVDGCTDTSGAFVHRNRERAWCSWAKKDPTLTVSRCSNNDLYTVCPVTCDSCPTPAPIPSSPTAPAPTPCLDTSGTFDIDGTTKNWCNWVKKDPTFTVNRCSTRNLSTFCPVACNSCPTLAPSVAPSHAPTLSTPAPQAAPVTLPPVMNPGTCDCCEKVEGKIDSMEIEVKKIQAIEQKVSTIDSKIDALMNYLMPPSTTSVPSASPVASTSAPSQSSPVLEVQYVGNPCGSFSPGGECAECTGDCDSDSDCAGDLRCAQRRSSGGEELVPGCVWGPNSDSLRFDDSDYCFLPISQPGIMNYVGECSSGSYLCGLCEGDCDSDSSCEGDLVCVERSGYSAVQGCTGEGGSRDMYDKDVCAPAQVPSPTPPSPTPDYLNSLIFNSNGCSGNSPCTNCEGPCSTSNDCEADLVCFQRSASESVPGCVTRGSGDVSGTNYCHEELTNGMPTYIPGDLTKRENGLVLSTGLSARIIAQTGSRVSYTNGGRSASSFHGDPDAGAVFEDTSVTNTGGWIYVSNSEKSVGGVGAITFNSNGDVINYEMILENTSQNCGGGKTYWGTWVTCEENGSSGQVWEVDPALPSNSQRNFPTVLGGTGGNYESFAYDARDRFNPTFYVTNDSSSGSLVRFTPDANTVQQAEQSGDYSNVLTTSGTLEWLMLHPVSGSAGDASGTFSWTSSRNTADSNANQFYQNTEGIDIRNGLLYFVTKRSKHLYILDLDALTYTKTSTVSGAFDGQPDQIKRILDQDPESEMLYFCEEASSDNGIHARDYEGNFYTIIDSDTLSSETTGLAFSPDNKHMYISYQSDGLIYDIVREDGYPFGSMRLDIKYHAD